MRDVSRNRQGESQMKIPEDTLNSCINYCLNEYVRLTEHRAILRDHWFEGKSTKELADKYKKSETAIKEVFRLGDRILLRAAKMSATK